MKRINLLELHSRLHDELPENKETGEVDTCGPECPHDFLPQKLCLGFYFPELLGLEEDSDEQVILLKTVFVARDRRFRSLPEEW